MHLCTLPDCLCTIKLINAVCAEANLDVQMIVAISGVTDITAFSLNSTESSNGISIKLNKSYKDVIQCKSIIQLIT